MLVCFPAYDVNIIHRHNVRQCLLTRGLLPMLATPQPHGNAVLGEAISMALQYLATKLTQMHVYWLAVLSVLHTGTTRVSAC